MTQRRTAAGQFALEEQRRRLVAAASEAILEKGLSGVTLAHIANHAGISTGSVNFYFSSKEELLLETLKAVTDEFYQSVWSAVEQAGTSPADRLRALVLSATDPAIIKPGSAAVWYAFMSEAKSRSEYQEVCARHDDQLHFLITELCRAVIDLADPPVEHNADVIALAISGLIDIAWQGVLFDSEGFDCQQIRLQSLAFLATVFPWVFVPDQGSNLSSRDFGRKDVAVTVRAAAREDVPALARLINLYRQNQGSPSDLPGSGSWVEEQLLTPGVCLLVAEEPGGKLHGFAHTIASSCPFTLSKFRIVRALFVDGDLRRGGVGQALLRRARELCRERGESQLEIDAPADNAVAKALYQTAGAREDLRTVRLVLKPTGAG